MAGSYHTNDNCEDAVDAFYYYIREIIKSVFVNHNNSHSLYWLLSSSLRRSSVSSR